METLRLLLQDDNMTDTAKSILNGWIKTTENVAGCQALRKKIGHILFGFRVCYGDSILVTVTPNRRNSALLLYLSRTRVNDTCFLAANSSTQQRKQHCGSESPNLLTQLGQDGRSPLGNTFAVHSRPTSMGCRGPVGHCASGSCSDADCGPGIFGIRMCFQCPHCNTDHCDLDPASDGGRCSACLGYNHKLMGGYDGLATTMAFSVKYTKD